MSPAAPRMKLSEYNLPLHILDEIMKRLPVKSLIQLRSVSKAWKFFIDSPEFIAAHCVHSHTQQHHLLLSYKNPHKEEKYVCFDDDDTFPQQWSVPTLPLLVKELYDPSVIGNSRGLLCLYESDRSRFVLWNPSIRKSIAVVAESKLSFAGFGVCPMTNDPKIVSITRYRCNQNNEISYGFKVMVYTLSSRKWRSLSTNLAAKRIQDWCMTAVVTNRFIYWHVGTQTHNMIMSFDVTIESFEVIDLPDILAHLDPLVLYISKLRESLAIIQSGIQSGVKITTVWMMEDGVQRSFTKPFTIKTPHNCIVGFRKNGIPIMEVEIGDPDDDLRMARLVYEPNSKHNNVLASCLSIFSINVKSYVKSLLLLGDSSLLM